MASFTSKQTMRTPRSTDGAWLSQIFSDSLEQIKLDSECGAFRSDRSRCVRFWKRTRSLWSVRSRIIDWINAPSDEQTGVMGPIYPVSPTVGCIIHCNPSRCYQHAVHGRQTDTQQFNGANQPEVIKAEDGQRETVCVEEFGFIHLYSSRATTTLSAQHTATKTQ